MRNEFGGTQNGRSPTPILSSKNGIFSVVSGMFSEITVDTMNKNVKRKAAIRRKDRRISCLKRLTFVYCWILSGKETGDFFEIDLFDTFYFFFNAQNDPEFLDITKEREEEMLAYVKLHVKDISDSSDKINSALKLK